MIFATFELRKFNLCVLGESLPDCVRIVRACWEDYSKRTGADPMWLSRAFSNTDISDNMLWWKISDCKPEDGRVNAWIDTHPLGEYRHD